MLEQAPRAGGQIHTLREPGLVVELGAEGFVARSRAMVALSQLLGMEDQLLEQLSTDTYVLEAGQLSLLPPGEAARRLGFQVPEEELGRGIRSLARGMGQIIEVLCQRLVGALTLQTEVEAIEREQSGALVARMASGERHQASAVVVAAPARVAARLLAPLLPQASSLASARLLSNVSVNLLFQREQLKLYPPGSGLLFPDAFAGVGLRALSLVEHKFAGRAPPGRSLVRVFFRPVGDALSDWSDDKFAATAVEAVAQALGVTGQPEQSWVSRWADALPVFDASHRASVAAVDAAAQELGVHLAGSAFHGAGIDAAVASAELVAARLCSRPG